MAALYAFHLGSSDFYQFSYIHGDRFCASWQPHILRVNKAA
jgi:hypothetical protein